MEVAVTAKPLTCSVPEAGRKLGIGRDSAYRAARNREIPVIKIGSRLLVPLAALEKMLEQAGQSNDRASRPCTMRHRNVPASPK